MGSAGHALPLARPVEVDLRVGRVQALNRSDVAAVHRSKSARQHEQILRLARGGSGLLDDVERAAGGSLAELLGWMHQLVFEWHVPVPADQARPLRALLQRVRRLRLPGIRLLLRRRGQGGGDLGTLGSSRGRRRGCLAPLAAAFDRRRRAALGASLGSGSSSGRLLRAASLFLGLLRLPTVGTVGIARILLLLVVVARVVAAALLITLVLVAVLLLLLIVCIVLVALFIIWWRGGGVGVVASWACDGRILLLFVA